MRRRLGALRDGAGAWIHQFFLGDAERPPFFDRRDWTLLIGLVFLTRGLGEIFPPAAGIAAGVVLVAAALGFSFAKGGV